MNILNKKNRGLDIDIKIRDQKAQLLVAIALIIIAIGIAWSFIKGWSNITIKTDMKNKIENNEVK